MKKIDFKNIFADALKCNHCGLCLQNCPAYRKYKEEIASPRARVQLAKFLVQKKIDFNAEEQALLKAAQSCQNCFNCTVLCPAGINPQDINAKLKELLNIEPPKQERNILNNLLFKIHFKKYFAEKDNLFLTSSCDFKQIKKTLETLKQNNFESGLYNKILTLPNLFFAGKTFKIPAHKKYIFDDIENYRIVKRDVFDGKLNINEKQILFITQTIKPHTVNLPQDALIMFSNVFASQEMAEDRQKLFANFKNKALNFVNNRYYFGPNFNEKTVEYLKQIPQNILITLSERERKFLTRIVRKYKIAKEIIPIQNLLNI